MAVTINSNQASLTVQRRLAEHGQTLSKTFAHLSSGLRINKASDDASGLAIAAGLNVGARIQGQGLRNVNDAISLLNIQEGAAKELTLIVIRLKELAEQAANGTLTSQQRLSLDSEAQSLSKEFTRISNTTSFNGLDLLNGSFKTLDVQAGETSVSLAMQNVGSTFTGDGTFKAPLSGTASQSSNALAVTSGDFNGDGLTDLAIGNNNVGTTQQLELRFGNGDGTFRVGTSYWIGNDRAMAMDAADMNGDGVLDIVSTTRLNSYINIMLGNSDGSFKLGVQYAGGGATGPGELLLGDITGDGITDVTYIGYGVRTYVNNGSGVLGAANSVTIPTSSDGGAIGDFNEDGKMDVVYALRTTDQIGLALGNNNGTFFAPALLGSGDAPYDVTVGDINGDGHLDLITVSLYDNRVNISLGNGNGTFLARTNFASGIQPHGVTLNDINSDGVQDILVYSATGGMNAFVGNGNGSFYAPTNFATLHDGNNQTPSAFTLADVNDDHGLDFVSVSLTQLSVVLGNGTVTSGLDRISLRTQNDALEALDSLTGSLRTLSSATAMIGSNQSRLSVAASNLTQSRENYLQSASRIMDADIAQESASVVRAQILQGATASLLAQANNFPALALELLSAN